MPLADARPQWRVGVHPPPGAEGRGRRRKGSCGGESHRVPSAAPAPLGARRRPPGKKRRVAPAAGPRGALPVREVPPSPAAAGLAQHGAARFLPGAGLGAAPPPRSLTICISPLLGRRRKPMPGAGAGGGGEGRQRGWGHRASVSRVARTALCIRLLLLSRCLCPGNRRGPYVPGQERGEGLRFGVAVAAPAPPRRQGLGAGAAAGPPRCCCGGIAAAGGRGRDVIGRVGPPPPPLYFFFFQKKTKPANQTPKT